MPRCPSLFMLSRVHSQKHKAATTLTHPFGPGILSASQLPSEHLSGRPSSPINSITFDSSRAWYSGCSWDHHIQNLVSNSLTGSTPLLTACRRKWSVHPWLIQSLTSLGRSVVRLANSLVRESCVYVCKIFCIRKEGYHPLWRDPKESTLSVDTIERSSPSLHFRMLNWERLCEDT